MHDADTNANTDPAYHTRGQKTVTGPNFAGTRISAAQSHRVSYEVVDFRLRERRLAVL